MHLCDLIITDMSYNIDKKYTQYSSGNGWFLQVNHACQGMKIHHAFVILCKQPNNSNKLNGQFRDPNLNMNNNRFNHKQ